MARMLSNLETESQKLINIIFVGQPELVAVINTKKLRQLAQRIQVHAKLSPLNIAQSHDYIIHRLQSAGERVAARFDDYAVKQIHKKSKGIPRLINAICDMGLLAAFSKNTYVIDKKIIKQALKEVPAYVYHT
jgi:general secretion pathway protein A